ncbi:hypothetical protein ALQ19_05569 [Pseudomonas syringae pv. berberidis]|nr:hypothetical protein ALQ19_05569 [Pseudomonas syringae pv. berberidis]
MPRLNRIIETALYVDDLAKAKSFYLTTLEQGSLRLQIVGF